MLENRMRDLIAADIQVLGSGLVLMEKEKFIPGTMGTRSFIDLYARDTEGRHVIIELKRSNVAARQAIHEVLKYLEV